MIAALKSTAFNSTELYSWKMAGEERYLILLTGTNGQKPIFEILLPRTAIAGVAASRTETLATGLNVLTMSNLKFTSYFRCQFLRLQNPCMASV